MNYRFNLLKIVPLATITVGLLAPIKIAQAAGGSAPIDQVNTIEHEAKEQGKGSHGGGHESSAVESHGGGYKQSSTAESHGGGHESSTAESHGDGHASSTAESHGDGHASSGSESHGASGIPEFLLSPQAQKIEFFTFLGAIGLYIVIPELFYSPKKIAKNFSKLENESSLSLDGTEGTENQQQPQEAGAPSFQVIESSHKFNREPQPQEVHTTSFEVIESSHKFEREPQPQEAGTPSFQVIEFNKTAEEPEEQVTELQPDIPTIGVISSNQQPHTIPTNKFNRTDTYGNTNLENWSQPDSKAA